MGAQTTVGTDYLYFGDGCNFSISEDSMSTWVDMGILDSDAQCVFNWTKTEYQTANKGKLDPVFKQMDLTGTIRLATQDPDKLEKIAGGLLEYAQTTTTPLTPEDTVIDEGDWADMVYYDMAPVDSSGNKVKFSTTPVVTNIVGGIDGNGVANDDYFIRADSRFYCGYGIAFNINGTNFVTTGLAQDMTIDYAANTPVATEIIYGGATIQSVTPVAMRFQRTDSNGKTLTLNMFEASIDPGGLQFTFLSQGSDGIEGIDVSFTVQLDTTRTNGRQLFEWITETGFTS